MLFLELAENSDSARDDLKGIQSVFNIASTLQKECQEANFALKNQEVVYGFHKKIEGCPRICMVGRSFVKQGTVTIFRNSKMETYHAFLFSDMMLLTKQNIDLSYKFREMLTFYVIEGEASQSLPCCVGVELVSDANGDFGLMVDVKIISSDKSSNESVRVIYVSSEEEALDWQKSFYYTKISSVYSATSSPSESWKTKSTNILKSLKIMSRSSPKSPPTSPRQNRFLRLSTFKWLVFEGLFVFK